MIRALSIGTMGALHAASQRARHEQSRQQDDAERHCPENRRALGSQPRSLRQPGANTRARTGKASRHRRAAGQQ